MLKIVKDNFNAKTIEDITDKSTKIEIIMNANMKRFSERARFVPELCYTNS